MQVVIRKYTAIVYAMVKSRTGRYGLAVCALVVIAAAALPLSVAAGAISRSYRIQGQSQPGDLVSLDTGRSDYGQLANTTNSTGLLGVVIRDGASLLAIDPSNSTVQVAINGTVPVLVSTMGGTIAAGDLVSVSPLNGIGMKAQPGLSVIGVAQARFSSTSSNASRQTVVDRESHNREVSVGLILVDIVINRNTGDKPGAGGLQKVVQKLIGHEVSMLRIIIATVVAIITILAISILLYASIFGSIISIGRNPLARQSIFKTLRSVLALALLIAVVAGVIIALLLS